MIKMGMSNVEFAQQYEQWKNFRQDTTIPAFSNFIELQYTQARVDWLVDQFETTEDWFELNVADLFSGGYDYAVQEWLDMPEEEIEPPVEDDVIEDVPYLDN